MSDGEVEAQWLSGWTVGQKVMSSDLSTSQLPAFLCINETYVIRSGYGRQPNDKSTLALS